MRTRFLNVDLELCAEFDLQPLLSNFDAAGFSVLNRKESDGNWYATIEPPASLGTQESAFADYFKQIESFDSEMQNLWNECIYREFDVGVELPRDYVGASHPVSNDLLTRIAAINGSLAFTAYVPTKIK